MSGAGDRPAPLGAVLAVTFLGSVSGGAFWTATYFVTARHYHFSSTRNLALGAVMGAAYTIVAAASGALTRRLARVLSPRAMLAGSLALPAFAALMPFLARDASAIVWPMAVLGVTGAAVCWPIVESYLTAGRHGRDMREAIGWFNVVWTIAVAVPLLIMPVIAARDILWTLVLCAVVNAVAIVLLPALPPRPGVHQAADAQGAVGREYHWLRRSAAVLLPVSYVISSTVSPVLPFRLQAIGVTAEWQSLIAATWMLARFLALAAMWRTGFWHGRWGTLAASAAGLVGGLAVVLLARSVAGVVTGLALVGTGMGLTYYAALYYAMSVGNAAVDAGGLFEALIGAGYTVGPLLGLGGAAAGGGAHGAQATVALTWLVVALAAWPALRPYLQARRQRG